MVNRLLMVYLIGLGSNCWPRLTHLLQALEHLRPLGQLQGISRLYLTEPWGMPPQTPPFLNACVQLDTLLSPEALLGKTQHIELILGRRVQDKGKVANRTLDLDLLAWNGPAIAGEKLTIPHPRMAQRRFVLLPLCDIAPRWIMPPPQQIPVAELLSLCQDTSKPLPLAGGAWPATGEPAPVPPECARFPGAPG